MQSKRIEILLNILFWVIMTWLFVFENNSIDILSIEVIDGKKHANTVRNWDKVYALLIAQLFAMALFYKELFLIHHLKRPKAVRSFVIKSLFLTVSAIIVYYTLIEVVIFPKNDGVKGLNLFVPLIIFYIAVVMCYGFTRKWIGQEQDKQQLLLVKNQAELNLLRQQLQPHFLFNTMNNLLAMVDQNENPKLARSIDKLSGLLRYVVYDTQQKKNTIGEEINFIKNFAELHLLRFEDDEVDFELSVKGTFDSQLAEPGILLCYVENAFKHGVQPEEKASIKIQFDLTIKNIIVFSIENSIPEHPFTYEKGGFGMKANQERLSLVYPNRHKIYIDKKDNYLLKLTLENDTGYNS